MGRTSCAYLVFVSRWSDDVKVLIEDTGFIFGLRLGQHFHFLAWGQLTFDTELFCDQELQIIGDWSDHER